MSKKPRSRWPGIDLPDDIEGPHRDIKPENGPAGKFSSVNKARARSTPGALNATEKARARTLDAKLLAGEIQGYDAQAVTFVLGHRCTYRPDFLVLELDGGLTFEEVKGSRAWKLDPKGRIKWKWAAERFPYFTFRGVIQKDGGGWEEPEEYVPRAAWPQ